jgi:hypothetical protein
LYRHGEVRFFVQGRTSGKILQYPKEVAFSLSFELRKDFLLELRKVAAPLFRSPIPEFFKFFQML